MATWFFKRHTSAEKGLLTEICVQDDELGILCHLAAPEDSISAWLVGLLKVARNPDLAKRCEYLATQSRTISDWKLAGDRSTFLRLAHALEVLWGHDETRSVPGREEAQKSVEHFLEHQFSFLATYDREGYVYGIWAHGSCLLHKRHPQVLALERIKPDCITKEHWMSAIQEVRTSNSSGLRQVFVDFELLHEAALRRVRLSSSEGLFVIQSFASFSKVIIDLLNQDPDYADLRPSVVPAVCATIVKDESQSLDEQKHYLEHILQSQEPSELRRRRLWDIVHDVEHDRFSGIYPQKDRPLAIRGLISDHFLENYDLDQAVAFWREPAQGDPVLALLVSLYRRPVRLLGAALIMFLALSVLSHLNVSGCAWMSFSHQFALCLALLLLGLICMLAIGMLGYLVYRIGWRRNLYYVQLFLPRLLGATIVGMSLIVLEDTSWALGAQQHLINYVLICSAVYLLPFISVYVVVYQTVKFLPASLVPSPATVYPEALARGRRWDELSSMIQSKIPLLRRGSHGSATERAVAISGRICAIGILESFMIVLVTTTLVYPATQLGLERDLIGGIVFEGSWVSLGFFPSLVFMWTGLAFSAGTFVQLLWLERRITSPT